MNLQPNVTHDANKELVSSMISIYQRDENFPKNYEILAKRIQVDSLLDYSCELGSLLLRELNEIRSSGENWINLGFINARYLTPLICSYIGSERTTRSVLDPISKVSPVTTLLTHTFLGIDSQKH